MSLANSNDRRWDITEDWQFLNIALDDLTDVIFDMDEDKAKDLLLSIAQAAQNDARYADHCAMGWYCIRVSRFARSLRERFEPVIQEWVDAKVEQAAERDTP